MRWQSLLAAAVVIPILAIGAGDAYAVEQSPEAWRVRLSTARRLTGKEHASFGRWCLRNDMPAFGERWRYLSLRFAPDDTKLRAHFGFTRTQEGVWTWDGAARLDFAEKFFAAQKGDAAEYRRRRKSLVKKATERFQALGRTALARAQKTTETEPEKWRDNVRQAAEWLLRIDPTHQKALESLGGKKVDGLFVHPDAVPYLNARAERKRRALARRSESVPVEFKKDTAASGWQTAGAEDAWVVTTRSRSECSMLTREMTYATREFLATHGLPPEFREKISLRYMCFGKNKDEMAILLRTYSSLKEPEILKTVERWGAQPLNNGHVCARTSRIEKAKAWAMSYRCRSGVRALKAWTKPSTDLTEAESIEPWLLEAVAMDVLIRLTGSYDVSFVDTSRYDNEGRSLDKEGRWLDVARDHLDLDVLPPIDHVLARTMNRLDARYTSTGYAFLQFLLERDEERAARFVALSAYAGSEAACRDVYKRDPSDFEDDFHHWLRVTR